MGFKEEILKNGNILRTYFANDISNLYKIYHNGHDILFPYQTMQLGLNQKINFMIDLKKLDLNFSLVNIKMRFKSNKPIFKSQIYLTKEKSMNSNNIDNIIGEFENPKKNVYEIDLTKYFYKKINTKLFFGIYTNKSIVFYSIYSSYDLMPEVIIEFVPKFKINKMLTFNFNRDTENIVCLNSGLSIIREKLIDSECTLYINLNSLKFNYNQYLLGGVKNYRYVDELGIIHKFKSIDNTLMQFVDIYNKNIKLVSNKDHTYMIYKDNNILFFNEKGLLERIQDEFGEEFVYYNEFRQIIAIKTKTGNLINFKYLKNIILVYNEIFSIGIFIEHKNIKIIDSLGKNVNYVVNKNVSKIMLKDKDILLKYDKLSRINLIKEISNNIIRDTNIKYEYLKTIVKKNNNKEIYFFNSFGEFTEKEGKVNV